MWLFINNEINGILIGFYLFLRIVRIFYKRFLIEVKNFIDINVDEVLI